MMPSHAFASMTSVSVIAPTPASSTSTFTESVESSTSAARSASTDPCVSAFRTIESSLTPPPSACAKNSSSVSRAAAAAGRSRCSDSRCATMSLATRSLSTTWNGSPASGTVVRPVMRTGTDGPASSTRCMFSSSMAPDASAARTHDDDVAAAQRALLDQHRGDRTPALVETRLEHDAGCALVRIGLELEHLGLQEHHLEQLLDPSAFRRRHLGADRL